MIGDRMTTISVEQLEEQLSSFAACERRAALEELSCRASCGQIALPPAREEVNLHYHTFFSFNANGWSPSRIAWEARKYGLAVAGIVDFDVLDGIEEFLEAGELIGLRSVAAMESRVFLSEYAQHVINSPNEPGITYFMAAGCFRKPDGSTRPSLILESMREMARRRNVQVMERVNDYLDVVRLDYQTDVIPLTPSGNATERHLLAAYDAKARQRFGSIPELSRFWADKIEISSEAAAELLADTPRFHEMIRSKLMKFGGVGYVAPSPDTFPPIELMTEMAVGIGALPTATWLDGTSSGEADTAAMFATLAAKGVVAVNLIPDRNWNIKDPDQKRVKLDKLREAVSAARQIDFPLCVGTEMNKAGLPFVDNFAAPELQPYIADFVEGAHFFWGHTALARAAGLGFQSEWAKAHFADRAAANAFYARVGRLADPRIPPSKLAGLDDSVSPEEVLRRLAG